MFHIFEQANKLLEFTLTFFSLSTLNSHDHVKYLLKADISLVLFTNKCMNLVNWNFAFNICLYFRLDMLIINIWAFFYIELVSVVHYHSRWPAKGFLIRPPFKPYHHRAIESSVISEFQTLVYFSSKWTNLSFCAYKSEPHNYPTIVSLSMTNFKLYLMPLPKIIIRK